MDADKVSSSIAARAAAQKKEIDRQRSLIEEDRKERAEKKTIHDIRERHQQDLVEISKQGTKQMEDAKKVHSSQMQDLYKTNNSNYLSEAERTAGEIKNVQGQWARELHDLKGKSLENLRHYSDRAQDPFYQMRSLNPALAEQEADYVISVALPEHEAANVICGAEGKVVTLSLARRFQEDYRDEANNRLTKTNSYQTVVDQVPLPGPVQGGRVSREYANGVLTFRFPKQVYSGKI